MNLSNKLLSEIVFFRSYPKYLPHLSRRESFEETINRDMTMHLDKFPRLSKDIIKAFSYVHDRKVMPSMRSLQFAGSGLLKNNLRNFNCAYQAIDDPKAFGEILFLLLSGCGVGFSVQGHHIAKLPVVKNPRQEGIHVVQDSIAGWGQALDILMEAYFYNRVRPIFDFSKISQKGTLLNTTGAKAPGAGPLEYMLKEVEARLRAAIGRQLRDIECHDIVCIASDCVLAGGIRRSSLVSLFDRTSVPMLKCKSGDWYIRHPYRARANNSAVLPRGEVTYEEFIELYKVCRDSKSGEPGFFWTNNKDVGANPCVEVSLLHGQLCNLSTISQSEIENKRDFLGRIHAATLLGTLQASYTDFPFMREIWKTTTEKEALIGVSFTGIADSYGSVSKDWLEEGVKLVLETNEKFAKKIGINIAARTTVLKPEGSASCVLGTSSGIHSRHDQYYLRRVRMSKNDALAAYLSACIPELVEDDKFAANTVVVTIPQESPPGAILRTEETAESLFNRILFYNENWIHPGHRSGDNYNNVSATINVKDDEWDSLRERLWENRAKYTAVSLLPFDGGSYVQAPFESCSKDKYEELSKLVTDIDLREVMEVDDNTALLQNVACSGGACEII